MALRLGELTAVITADDKRFRDTVDKDKERLESFKGAAVTASTVIVGAAAAASVNLIGMASEAQQAAGAVESVFGASAAQIQAWAEQAHESVGLSEQAFNELAAVTGAQLKNMGLPMDQVAEQTNNLIGLGADLAATFGGPTSDAVAAIGSLLRGEVDPIERYGVSIKEADIQARLAAQGLDELEGEAAKQARTQAILALLTEQTADAQGQFARESDTAAGQAQRAQAQWANLRTELGENLLPIATSLGKFLSGELLPALRENSDVVMAVAGTVVGLATAVVAINAALKVWRAMVVVATVAQWAWNIALSANPIGLIIIAIAALIAGIILLWKNSETFRDIVMAVWDAVWGAIKFVWDWISENWPLLLAILTGPIGLATKFIIDHWDQIIAGVKGVWNWIKDTFNKVVGFVRGLPGRIADAARGLWDGIIDSFRAAINWVIARWNSFSLTLGGGSVLGIDIPSVTLSTPDIPLLARGGIVPAVPGGRLIIAGEGGRDEAVVPVDRLESMIRSAVRAGDGAQVPAEFIAEATIDLGEGIQQVVELKFRRRDRDLRRRVLAGTGAAR